MIWLVTLGLSRYHGSELLVGWQWLTRLNATAPTTAIISKVFDSDEFIQEEDRNRIIFIDTKPESPDEINRKHFTHAYRFWRSTQKILAERVQPGDKIVVVAPAAIWFIPWLPKLPIPRSSVYYGPLGAVLLPRSPGARHALVYVKNMLTILLMLIWKLAYCRLPGNLSLRFPAQWFTDFLKSRFTFLEVMPEVEAPLAATLVSNEVRTPDAPVAVLFDDRLRKNFTNSIAYGAAVAHEARRKLTVIGAPDVIRQGIKATAASAGCEVEFKERLSRTEFVNWLSLNRPIFVSLSLSEGVPSTLIEALCVGCEVHVYAVGGLQWLIKFAATHSTAASPWGIVEKINWDQKSALNYQEYVENTYARLINRIVAVRQ